MGNGYTSPYDNLNVATKHTTKHLAGYITLLQVIILIFFIVICFKLYICKLVRIVI